MPKNITLTSLNPGYPPYRQPYCSVGNRNTRSTTKYAVTSRSTTQVVPFDLPPCYTMSQVEPRHEKTSFLHMPKQRRRSASS